jgi:hypothetical protein
VKKNGLFLGMLGIVLAFGLLFTGCEPEPKLGGDEDKYTVTFDANGGTVTPTSVQVISGKAVEKFPTLTKEDTPNIFWGWFTGNGPENGWGDFFTESTVVTADITVYAKWTATGGVTITDADVCDWNGKPLTELTKTFTHYYGHGSSEMKTLASAGISDFVVENGKLNATLPGMPKVFESNADLITKLKITKMSDPDAKIFFLNALRDSAVDSGPSLLYFYRNNGEEGHSSYYIYSDRDVVITGSRELTLKAGWNISDDHPYRWTYKDFD